jgi:nucleotide-binding universal stress UspA family protein
MSVTENQIELLLDRIVVATDFTPESERVVSYASALAKHFASQLTLVHVIDLSVVTFSGAIDGGVLVDAMRHDSGENMHKALRELSSIGLRVQGQVLEAHDPAGAILLFCDQQNADLLVIGTHSRHGLRKIILGSIAQDIIHRAKCPVLTIGPNTKPVSSEKTSFSTILFATDLQHDIAEKAATALAIAQDGVARIYMCHVLQDTGTNISETLALQLEAEVALRKLVPEASYDWCCPEYVVESGNVSDRILKVVRDAGVDLIILGARRSSNWLDRLNEGVVEKVLAEADCPVMTLCTD